MTEVAAYYNENDPYAAQWLRNLIDAGHIAPGYVDERSIEDVKPEDLAGYTQCHFFAGIGGWSLALRIAGWPDDRPIWTGSPPCQPFSAAGRRQGYDDARHLAPKWLDLIRECRPSAVYGEQVASAASGKQWAWLDDLQDALEAQDYATGAIVLPACGFGAPHIRQRIFFVGRLADNQGRRRGEEQPYRRGMREGVDSSRYEAGGLGAGGATGGVADAGQQRVRGRQPGGVAGTPEASSGEIRERQRVRADVEYGGARSGDAPGARPSPPHSFWSDADWLFCRDGKWRPVESGTFPLVNGVPARVGRLRAYGNAIVPQEAAQVIRATL